MGKMGGGWWPWMPSEDQGGRLIGCRKVERPDAGWLGENSTRLFCRLLLLWGFYAALAGQRLWKEELSE